MTTFESSNLTIISYILLKSVFMLNVNCILILFHCQFYFQIHFYHHLKILKIVPKRIRENFVLFLFLCCENGIIKLMHYKINLKFLIKFVMISILITHISRIYKEGILRNDKICRQNEPFNWF